MRRADSNDDECVCIAADATVTVQYGHTGRVLLVAETAEEMRDYRLRDCVVSAVAVAEDIPRIQVQLQWRRAGSRAFTAIYTAAMSTAWLEEDDDNYDYRFDHNSEKLEEFLPSMPVDKYPCVCCGDEADDVDDDVFRERADLCQRCEPCAVCDACRFEINGIPGCIRCVNDEEIPLIPERAQRRLSTFWSADPEQEQSADHLSL